MYKSLLAILLLFFLVHISAASFEPSKNSSVSNIQSIDSTIGKLFVTRVEINKPVKGHHGGVRAQFGTFEFWLYFGISLFLILFAGLMSGLTVGYLSIDELVLELKLKNGTGKEKKQVILSFTFPSLKRFWRS